jgi:hypothetical protein
MTEVEFTSSPGRQIEEPLYLDSARPRAANPRPAMGAERPLHLDLQPRRRRRGIPLVLACTLTFLLGAGAGVLYLEPPSVLRDTFSRVLGSQEAGGATAAQAAPTAPQPAHDQAAIPVAQPEAISLPESPVVPSAIPDEPPATAQLPEPPAKPRGAASKPRPARAAAPKKHAADARPARAPTKAKPPLDLDALEKSLQ